MCGLQKPIRDGMLFVHLTCCRPFTFNYLLLSITFQSNEKNTIIVKIIFETIGCPSRPSIHFAESVEQDQPVRTCSLILLCTRRCFIIDFCPRKPIQLHLTLPNDKSLDWSKFKAFADDTIKVLKIIIFCL